MNTVGQREEDLFDAARRIHDATDRAGYLDRTCRDDPGLRARLDELLGAASAAETFFAEGGSALTFSLAPVRSSTHTGTGGEKRSDPRLPEEKIGTRIGRYKLVQKLGEGGCGVVYLAEQEEPVRRRVALKIIKLGMETRTVIDRFEAERQALAMMDHPNIARVFDAGETDRGSPYFVMELVRGLRITEYCDQNQLDVRRRLDLFVQICHAIQHAHQKGIIHRDIKPSNIIVTLHDGLPVPKVIDFGIAKATEAHLTDKVLYTAYAQLIGTPAYMSPEQAAMGGIDIDTRSDIYSLGVLLYELLTARTPFDAKALAEAGLDEMRRTLREREPTRPSQRLHTLPADELAKTAANRESEPARLISRLRGDLDWVVMKALEKDRARRYETANGLAMDIERHLENEPVIARPPSWFYRLRKLVRRNRGVFVAGGAVAAVLVAGLGTSTWLFLREREARERAVAAEQQQAKLRREAEVRERITQAALLVSQERHAEADTILREVSLDQPTLEGAVVFRAVGEWHALHHRWREAADRFAQLLAVNQLDGLDVSSLDHLEHGPVLIELGDAVAYDEFRREAISRFGDAPGAFADRIVKISLLAPADEPLLARLRPLADATVRSINEAVAAGDIFRAAWGSLSIALWEYRRGNFAAAEVWCRQCLDYPEVNAPRSTTAHLIRAMASWRLARADNARADLAAARLLIETKGRHLGGRGTPVQGFWFDWAFARILWREATKMIEPPPDAS